MRRLSVRGSHTSRNTRRVWCHGCHRCSMSHPLRSGFVCVLYGVLRTLETTGRSESAGKAAARLQSVTTGKSARYKEDLPTEAACCAQLA